MTSNFTISLEESKQKAESYMAEGYHCGPSILQIMHEALGDDDESMLWAGINMFGGMTRHREGVCGAVTALAVYLGFHYRKAPFDKEGAAMVNTRSHEMIQDFKDRYGSIVCRELLGITNMTEEERARFFAEKKYEDQCNDYVKYVVEKLYELGVRNEK